MATIGKVLKDVGTGIFNRTLGRLTGAGISTDSRIPRAKAKWSGRSDKEDWRVRLQIPAGADALRGAILDNNALLEPLQESNGMFWPLTPAVVIQHSANYNPLAQTHSNYPFQAYQNSQVDSYNIIGEFEGYKSGHTQNNLLLKKLQESPETWELISSDGDAPEIKYIEPIIDPSSG